MKLTQPFHTLSRLSWDIAKESAATVLACELYPLGLLSDSLPTLPSFKNKQPASQVPILFIHGILHNRSTFAWLKQKLYSQGYRRFKELNLLTSIHPITYLAEQVARESRLLMKQYKVPQIDIIAHSKGGLIGRYYIQMLGGDGVVRNLITLGSPHQGTSLSQISFLPGHKDLTPESQTLAQLNQCPPPKHTRAVAISGTLDVVIRPKHCRVWNGVRNIHLSRVGHAGLLFSNRVLDIILSHLQTEDPMNEGL